MFLYSNYRSQKRQVDRQAPNKTFLATVVTLTKHRFPRALECVFCLIICALIWSYNSSVSGHFVLYMSGSGLGVNHTKDGTRHTVRQIA